MDSDWRECGEGMNRPGPVHSDAPDDKTDRKAYQVTTVGSSNRDLPVYTLYIDDFWINDDGEPNLYDMKKYGYFRGTGNRTGRRVFFNWDNVVCIRDVESE